MMRFQIVFLMKQGLNLKIDPEHFEGNSLVSKKRDKKNDYHSTSCQENSESRILQQNSE